MALAGNMVRALTIARTETLGAYRSAAAITYRANSDVVESWTWQAALGSACEICIALHGQVFPLEEEQDTHPNCRCTMIPQTRTWESLGFPDAPETRVELEPGPDWFARQPPAKQLRVLGPGKYAAYKRGEITLADLVQKTRSAFGPGRHTRPLRELVHRRPPTR
jgi:SPP1 gp7 family putative phage head morphogenesis protein